MARIKIARKKEKSLWELVNWKKLKVPFQCGLCGETVTRGAVRKHYRRHRHELEAYRRDWRLIVDPPRWMARSGAKVQVPEVLQDFADHGVLRDDSTTRGFATLTHPNTNSVLFIMAPGGSGPRFSWISPLGSKTTDFVGDIVDLIRKLEGAE